MLALALAVQLQVLPSPAKLQSGGPSLHAGKAGVHMTWLEPGRLMHALWNGKAWTKPAAVAAGPRLVVNWADFPSLTELDDGTLAAHWLEGDAVRVSRSVDGGKTWSAAVSPHAAGAAKERGFVSLVPLPKGRFAAVWLDGLKDGSQRLHAAVHDGASFGKPETVDGKICDCCQTTAAPAPDGFFAAYRDRTDREVRDISVARFSNGKWEAPRTLHDDGWVMKGCPVNGPSASSRGEKAAVAWFTGAGGAPKTLVAFSGDSARTFSRPVRFDEGGPQGRVAVQLLMDGSAVVVWLEGGPNRLLARRIFPDGKAGKAARVGGAAKGFPRLALDGSAVLLAWPDAKSVRVARLDPETLR